MFIRISSVGLTPRRRPKTLRVPVVPRLTAAIAPTIKRLVRNRLSFAINDPSGLATQIGIDVPDGFLISYNGGAPSANDLLIPAPFAPSDTYDIVPGFAAPASAQIAVSLSGTNGVIVALPLPVAVVDPIWPTFADPSPLPIAAANGTSAALPPILLTNPDGVVFDAASIQWAADASQHLQLGGPNLATDVTGSFGDPDADNILNGLLAYPQPGATRGDALTLTLPGAAGEGTGAARSIVLANRAPAWVDAPPSIAVSVAANKVNDLPLTVPTDDDGDVVSVTLAASTLVGATFGFASGGGTAFVDTFDAIPQPDTAGGVYGTTLTRDTTPGTSSALTLDVNSFSAVGGQLVVRTSQPWRLTKPWESTAPGARVRWRTPTGGALDARMSLILGGNSLNNTIDKDNMILARPKADGTAIDLYSRESGLSGPPRSTLTVAGAPIAQGDEIGRTLLASGQWQLQIRRAANIPADNSDTDDALWANIGAAFTPTQQSGAAWVGTPAIQYYGVGAPAGPAAGAGSAVADSIGGGPPGGGAAIFTTLPVGGATAAANLPNLKLRIGAGAPTLGNVTFALTDSNGGSTAVAITIVDAATQTKPVFAYSGGTIVRADATPLALLTVPGLTLTVPTGRTIASYAVRYPGGTTVADILRPSTGGTLSSASAVLSVTAAGKANLVAQPANDIAGTRSIEASFTLDNGLQSNWITIPLSYNAVVFRAPTWAAPAAAIPVTTSGRATVAGITQPVADTANGEATATFDVVSFANSAGGTIYVNGSAVTGAVNGIPATAPGVLKLETAFAAGATGATTIVLRAKDRFGRASPNVQIDLSVSVGSFGAPFWATDPAYAALPKRALASIPATEIHGVGIIPAIYDPATKSWTEMAMLPDPLMFDGIAATGRDYVDPKLSVGPSGWNVYVHTGPKHPVLQTDFGFVGMKLAYPDTGHYEIVLWPVWVPAVQPAFPFDTAAPDSKGKYVGVGFYDQNSSRTIDNQLDTAPKDFYVALLDKNGAVLQKRGQPNAWPNDPSKLQPFNSSACSREPRLLPDAESDWTPPSGTAKVTLANAWWGRNHVRQAMIFLPTADNAMPRRTDAEIAAALPLTMHDPAPWAFKSGNAVNSVNFNMSLGQINGSGCLYTFPWNFRTSDQIFADTSAPGYLSPAEAAAFADSDGTRNTCYEGRFARYQALHGQIEYYPGNRGLMSQHSSPGGIRHDRGFMPSWAANGLYTPNAAHPTARRADGTRPTWLDVMRECMLQMASWPLHALNLGQTTKIQPMLRGVDTTTLSEADANYGTNVAGNTPLRWYTSGLMSAAPSMPAAFISAADNRFVCPSPSKGPWQLSSVKSKDASKGTYARASRQTYFDFAHTDQLHNHNHPAWGMYAFKSALPVLLQRGFWDFTRIYWSKSYCWGNPAPAAFREHAWCLSMGALLYAGATTCAEVSYSRTEILQAFSDGAKTFGTRQSSGLNYLTELEPGGSTNVSLKDFKRLQAYFARNYGSGQYESQGFVDANGVTQPGNRYLCSDFQNGYSLSAYGLAQACGLLPALRTFGPADTQAMNGRVLDANINILERWATIRTGVGRDYNNKGYGKPACYAYTLFDTNGDLTRLPFQTPAQWAAYIQSLFGHRHAPGDVTIDHSKDTPTTRTNFLATSYSAWDWAQEYNVKTVIRFPSPETFDLAGNPLDHENQMDDNDQGPHYLRASCMWLYLLGRRGADIEIGIERGFKQFRYYFTQPRRDSKGQFQMFFAVERRECPPKSFRDPATGTTVTIPTDFGRNTPIL